MSLADLLRFQIIAASLVNCHLTRLTTVTLTTKAPDSVVTFLAVSCLKSLGNKSVSVDPPNFLPPTSTTTLVDSHCRGGYHGEVALTTDKQ